MGKIVAIVGRPNVGKSTLFNRLVGARTAIVDDVSGVTRDRHYGTAEWIGKEFVVVDTGGYVADSDEFFEVQIRNQVEIAINEADLLIFLVDGQTGATPHDEAFAHVLRKSKKPVVVAVNKVDTFDKMYMLADFYSMGFEEVMPLSAVNGTGSGEVLDRVVELLGLEEKEEMPDMPKIAILGRPNVGKSTLTNALLDEERNIVSNIPGTTRDSIHSVYRKFGKEFVLIDTAGLRKKGKTMEDVEFYSVMRAIRSLEESDVVLLVLDATEGMQSQDVNILRLAEHRKKGVVILVNKWDLVEKDHKSTDQYKKAILEKTAPFVDIPVIFISATEKQRIFKAVETALEVYDNRRRHIPTSKLNEVMLPYIQQTPPPSNKGKYIRIKYITQLHTTAPSFAFFCNLPQYVREPYKRFLENKLRENFQLSGVPVNIFIREK